MSTPVNVKNEELELKVSNVFNQGDAGSQNFYTLQRAKSDIYSAIKNDEDFVMGFPNEGVIHAFLNSSNKIEYSLYKTAEAWKNNEIADGGVSAIDIDKGVSFDDIEDLINMAISELNYKDVNRLDFEDLAAEVIRRGIPYSSYNSDLYLPKTEEVKDLLSRMTHPNNVTSFISQIDNSPQLEVPFAYDKGIFHRIETDALVSSLSEDESEDIEPTMGRTL